MSRRALGAIAVAALGIPAGSAIAADEVGKWYINPQIGYIWADRARNVDDDMYWGLGVGKHISDRWSIEFNGAWAPLDGDGSFSLDQYAASFDALMVFGRTKSVSPYLTFGTGYINNDPHPGEKREGVLAQAGVGLLMDAYENAERTFVFQIRPEAKLRYDWACVPNHKDCHDYLFNLGFAFNFGGARYSPPPPAPPPPPPAAMAPPPPPPPGPVDSDGDGVLDDADQCPATPRGTAVDARGCPRAGSVTLQGVTFDNAKATLTPEARDILNGVAADLKAHPRLKVEMQGHTDSVGAAAYNLDLSQRRALSVRDYLVSQGVSADNVTAKGYGETVPVADNATPAGRAENRRVVMSVIDNPGDVTIKQ